MGKSMNKKLMPLLILAGLLVVTLAACGGGASGTGGDPLDGTSWTLTAYRKTRPIPGTMIDITFEDGELRGSAGCNSYFGSYEVSGSTITVGDVAMTEMACMEPEGVMEQETEVLAILTAGETFQIDDGQLQIFRPDGEALTFVAQR
jgi:heat shock protein HslJ